MSWRQSNVAGPNSTRGGAPFPAAGGFRPTVVSCMFRTLPRNVGHARWIGQAAAPAPGRVLPRSENAVPDGRLTIRAATFPPG
jgi:hypothetical protein